MLSEEIFTILFISNINDLNIKTNLLFLYREVIILTTMNCYSCSPLHLNFGFDQNRTVVLSIFTGTYNGSFGELAFCLRGQGLYSPLEYAQLSGCPQLQHANILILSPGPPRGGGAGGDFALGPEGARAGPSLKRRRKKKRTLTQIHLLLHLDLLF